jgi:hypothetical protein
MAGDWLKVETSTPDKPEILQMAHDLSIDPDAVVGKLIRVWSWFDSHSEEGNAPSVSKLLLDRSVGVTGFVNCMISVDWMREEGETLTIPNFDNHNGASAKKRANTARRVAKLKALRDAEEKELKATDANTNASANAELTPEELAKPLAREEKRREEKKELIKDKHAALAEALCVDLALIKRIVKHRADIKKPANTDKKIKLVINNFQTCIDQGLFQTLDQAMDRLDNEQWQTVKPEYINNGNNYAKNNQGSRFTSPSQQAGERIVADARNSYDPSEAF